ncbi:MAG: flagellar basal body P-ring formation chaperone FlgA [Methylotenera sp.]|uniref:flagellar basal body P-ring formation chaperone FlgA n=1 Tax=Methylotenera sp. TaxID=2051956 RepID=UPI0024889D67|nr:flagellar basal body P-ring formation chaperone FlgA [Methylotenera sp.]MDI1308038.1 flagellar basal body P-ring formation chaperone FlgA [Methylotenera sp.]
MFNRNQFKVLINLLSNVAAFSLICSLMSPAISFAESVTPVTATAAPMGKQNLAQIKTKITEFLETQTIGYPGKVSVRAGAIDPNLKLAQCPDMQVFMPTGSRAWGKTSVGVRCNAPNVWTIYVQASVNVLAQYLVAASPLAQGQTVTDQDMMFENGDLTQLPAGVFTEQSQALGRTVNISMTVGTVLRQELLRVTPVVQPGQTVMVTSKGQGFSVSAEGLSMAKANEGQVVQVKVASGQIVTGIARNGGQVEVGF